MAYGAGIITISVLESRCNARGLRHAPDLVDACPRAEQLEKPVLQFFVQWRSSADCVLDRLQPSLFVRNGGHENCDYHGWYDVNFGALELLIHLQVRLKVKPSHHVDCIASREGPNVGCRCSGGVEDWCRYNSGDLSCKSVNYTCGLVVHPIMLILPDSLLDQRRRPFRAGQLNHGE